MQAFFGSMEEEKDANFSWWSDSHNRPCQSQWLQVTLTDLDRKTKTIVGVIQGDGDSFAKRAEMFYKRRHELIQMLYDLHESYRSLYHTFDLLRSQHTSDHHVLLHYLNIQPNAQGDNHNPSSPGGHEDETNASREYQISSLNIGSPTTDKVLQLCLSKLIEDKVRQQNEMVRRNEEKREVIKQLRARVNRLMEENRMLKSYLPSYYKNMDIKRHYSSNKFKGLDCIGKIKT